MSLTVNQRRLLRQGIQITSAGTILGIIYIVLSDGFTAFYPFVNGIIGGFLVGLTISVLELIVFRTRGFRLSFITIIALRTLLYGVLIFLILLNILVVSRMIRFELSYREVLVSDEFINYMLQEDFFIAFIYAMVFAFSVNFIRILSRRMGQGVLLSFITGTYYKPKVQERIFMFLNIKDYDKIAEKLGLTTLYRFYNSILYDITESVIINRGIVYESMDGGLIVSWDTKKGLGNAHCIRTFFQAREKLDSLKEKYLEAFGVIPMIKASFHTGEVVRAEVGDVKAQIVFHGDVMNTTARILEKCDELEEDILISANLVLRLKLPPIFKKIERGRIKLKGKEEEVILFGIKETEFEHV